MFMKWLFASVLLISLSCLPIHYRSGEYLQTLIVSREEIKGDFRMILYGANHSNDLETVAVLDKEGDNIRFVPLAPDFIYRTEDKISAEEGLEKSIKFISWHRAFLSYEIKKIMDRENNILGYELRPLYDPLTFGITDILDIDYIAQDDVVKVIVRLKPSIERMLFNDKKDFQEDQ